MKFNYTCSEIEFYAVLRQRGLLTHWINFDKLKYRNVVDNKDFTGGKIRVDKLKKIAESIGVNYNTLRQSIMVMYQEGWVYKTPNNKSYVLRSWKYIVKRYKLQISKFRIKAANKAELTKKIVLRYIHRSISIQVYTNREKQGLSTHKRILAALQKDKEFSVSVRQVAKAIGLKSAMTGSLKLRELAKDCLIKIEKQDNYICELEHYGAMLRLDENLKHRAFIKDGCVYERKRSNIVILEKPLTSKQKLAQKLLKFAKIERMKHTL